MGAGNQRDGPDDRRPEAEPDQGLAGARQPGAGRRHGRVSAALAVDTAIFSYNILLQLLQLLLC